MIGLSIGFNQDFQGDVATTRGISKNPTSTRNFYPSKFPRNIHPIPIQPSFIPIQIESHIYQFSLELSNIFVNERFIKLARVVYLLRPEDFSIEIQRSKFKKCTLISIEMLNLNRQSISRSSSFSRSY